MEDQPEGSAPSQALSHDTSHHSQSQVQNVTSPYSEGSHLRNEDDEERSAIGGDRVSEHSGGRAETTLRRQAGIKRACTECRQQKLRCDVIKDPFTICSRCRRLQLGCKIDISFKRVEKRRAKKDRHRMRETSSPPVINHSSSQPALLTDDEPIVFNPSSHTSTRALPTIPIIPIDLRQGHDSAESQWSDNTISSQLPTHPATSQVTAPESSAVQEQSFQGMSFYSDSQLGLFLSRKLDGVEIGGSEIQTLFQLFFTHYHQFLPFLQPSKSPDYYYRSSRLLFWTVISVASRRYSSDLSLLASLSLSVPQLMWSVLQSVPQNHHDVKALCLLCTWPFPIHSSSCDPTFMLSGTMMNLAMQVGLHRPSQAQDFSKVTMKLPQEEIQDRTMTWVACKIVAQSVATGYGQPPIGIFDGTVDSALATIPGQGISQELGDRLVIEKFCDRVAKSLWFMPDRIKTSNSDLQSDIGSLSQELRQLEQDLINETTSTIILLYIRCANLHLRLYALFETTASPNYVTSLLSLYEACQVVLSPFLAPDDDILLYCPNYVCQMILASCFTVLKLLQSPLSEHIDAMAARALFNAGIATVRKISVSNNDIPGRLAEVLAQLMARGKRIMPVNNTDWHRLQLKVRSRMSMSVMFDGLWEWRKGFEAETGGDPSSTQDRFLFPSLLLGSRPKTTTDATGEETARPGPSHLFHSPTVAPTDSQTGFGSHVTAQPDIDFNNLAFDDFYPVNWLIETEMPTTTTIPDDVTA